MSDPTLLPALFAYHTYATNLLLQTAARLTPEQITQPVSRSHTSVFELLRHFLVTVDFFVQTCQNRSMEGVELAGFDELRQYADRVHREGQAYVDGLTPADLETEVVVTMGQHSFQLPRWQLLTQALVHGVHHRGELCYLLGQFGQDVPNLDIIIPFAESSGQPWPWKNNRPSD